MSKIIVKDLRCFEHLKTPGRYAIPDPNLLEYAHLKQYLEFDRMWIEAAKPPQERPEELISEIWDIEDIEPIYPTCNHEFQSIKVKPMESPGLGITYDFRYAYCSKCERWVCSAGNEYIMKMPPDIEETFLQADKALDEYRENEKMCRNVNINDVANEYRNMIHGSIHNKPVH